MNSLQDLKDEVSKEYIDKLVIRAREEEEDSIQDLDLIKQKMTIIKVEISEERTLSHVSLYEEKMVDFINQESPFNRLV